MDKTKLDALLSLLDDPNPEIFKSVSKQLLELPITVIPELEDMWLESKDQTLQNRLEEIIKRIEFNSVKNELIKWSQGKVINLIKGAMLVSKSYNPHLLEEPIRKIIKKIRTDIWLELNERLTALEKIRVLNQIFFLHYNFKTIPPNTPYNWDGDISAVLSQKQGNYIIMAILYAGIAQELQLPVYGLNLPGSVLLTYVDINTKPNHKGEHPVLFYINPIDHGNVFGRKDLEFIIRQKGIQNLKSHYHQCSNVVLIKRLLEHEISTYHKLNLSTYIPYFQELFHSL